MNKIYCSTGALVGRVCGYDYSLIQKHLPSLYEQGIIDGMEFMMIPFYYDILDNVIRVARSCNIPTPIIHCEKDVGVLLSECDNLATERALELLKKNCNAGAQIGADKMVFHLWGGTKSDYHIEYNASILSQILEITDSYGLRLLIENIPCTTYSGLENWKRLNEYFPKIDLIFDTRFGAFHDEIDKILDDPIREKIKHIHISDYSSFPRDFSKIRPILHPGEGVINFDALFEKLKKIGYSHSFTLESPVMIPSGADIDKLTHSLCFIKSKLK